MLFGMFLGDVMLGAEDEGGRVVFNVDDPVGVTTRGNSWFCTYVNFICMVNNIETALYFTVAL